MLPEKIQGPRPGFIEIKIDLQAVPRGALDQSEELLLAPLEADAHPLVPRERRQVRQQPLQPNSAHPGLRQPRQVTVRIRVQVRIQQGIPVQGEIRITEARHGCLARVRRTWRNGGIGGRTQPGHETEKRFLAGQRHMAKRFAHDRRDLRRSRALRRRRRGPVQRFTPGFERSEFDEQEIVLAQRERELFGSPTQQRQELVVREQMPVPADHRDERPLLDLPRDCRGRPQSQQLAQLLQVRFPRPDRRRHPRQRNQLPVPPDECLHSAAEMRATERRRGRTRRQQIHGVGPTQIMAGTQSSPSQERTPEK